MNLHWLIPIGCLQIDLPFCSWQREEQTHSVLSRGLQNPDLRAVKRDQSGKE